MGKKLLVGLCICSAMLSGCADTSVSDRVNSGSLHLPPNAANIKRLDNYWLQFDIDGKTYYYGQVGPLGGTDTSVCFAK